MNRQLLSTGIMALLFIPLSVQLSYGQGSSILFYRGEDIYSINPDGTNLLTVETGGRDPIWSPDGNSILFKRQANSMWIAFSDGRASVPLGEGSQHAWSHNGQQIVFGRGGVLYLINKDGTGERQLVSAERGGNAYPRWSPANDSLLVYYRQRNDTDATDIFFVNVFSEESRLVQAFAYIPNLQYPFSPDGTRLLVSNCFDGSACLKILNLTTSDLIQIGPSGLRSAQQPAWSPDGSHIMYTIPDNMGGLYLASSNGQVTTELVSAQTDAVPAGAAWSPNGDMIAFHMMGKGIYLINADGSGMHKLTDGSGPVVWSPIRSGVPGGTNIQMLPWGLLKSQ